MIDSIDVLMALKVVYSVYALIAISLIARFGWQVTRPVEGANEAKPILFWSYVGVLAVIGTGLHFFTYGQIPWVSTDLNRAHIEAHKTFDITYQKHQITLSEKPMRVDCGKPVVFNATSLDLTYGFGIFRYDNTLVTQMQVVPRSRNDLMWIFHKNGTYYIRSTEYSGPKGAKMIVNDALVVSGCNEDDINAIKVGGI